MFSKPGKFDWDLVFKFHCLMSSLTITAGFEAASNAAGCIAYTHTRSQSAEDDLPPSPKSTSVQSDLCPWHWHIKLRFMSRFLARIPTTFHRSLSLVSPPNFCHWQPNERSLNLSVLLLVKAVRVPCRTERFADRQTDRQRQIRGRQRHRDQTNNFKKRSLWWIECF